MIRKMLRVCLAIAVFFIFNEVKAQDNDISVIVFKIANINRFDSRHTGFAGTKSDQYANFEQLKEKADSSQLTELIKTHNNGVVRLYAAQALKEKTGNLPTELAAILKEDDTRISAMSGCIVLTQTVSTILKTGLAQ